MTLIEAIHRIDAIKPNNYSKDEKIKWLSTLDGMVSRHVIDTHTGEEAVWFSGYDESTPEDTELLVPAPYEDIYLRWLEAQIDYANGEYGKYNNAILTYNTVYEAYANDYNRTHMPKGGRRFRF